MSIYVETRIRGSMDEVWRLTQTPDLHERWDVRFTSITYLDRASDSQPQCFRYGTRIGFGFQIEGWGETVGDRAADGTRISALKFGSEDWRSLIRAGSGYWRYEQVQDQVRFITGYDYDVRWGMIGRVIDALVFRPLLGWATAWSFDRMRIWIEAGVEPSRAARQALVHALAAAAVAFVWMWHGIVPKLAGPHPDELGMLLEAGVSEQWLRPVTLIIGAIELAFGLAFLVFARRRWPWLLTMTLMAIATVGVLVTSPHRAVAAFGPVTLNLLLAVLAAVGLLSLRDLPSARRCLRRAPKELHVENGS
ncbi:MAG: DoxX-like family protein [Planctomycetota bacterium]|nr:DoxX-like family protein [Planctomycetota bacterium]